MTFRTTLLTIFFFNVLVAQEADPPKEIDETTTIQKIGDYGQFAPAAVSLVAILTHKDKKGLWQFSKSFGTNLAVTYALKYGINKTRPKGRVDGKGFPSGHTSAAFLGASFLQRRYGWKYGIPAYAVASFVGYSRVAGGSHDAWDVLAGAVVGIGSTYLFTTPYARDHLVLSFKSGDGNYLLGLNYKF